MADEQQTTAEAQEAPAEAIVDVDATAERLTEIASQSLDTNEVARQIEELTSVVLDSAEVSTRSASIAADVSATMRAVVSKIQENNRRNVMHSRIMLGAFCACLLIAMGIFFAITMKMTKSIKELDTMVYAMAKRVIEVDASLTAIGKTNSDFSEITDKQEEVITTQTQVAKRLEELSKSMANMPTVVATEANKSSDLKFKDMQKQLTTLEGKLQSFDGKLQTVAEKASARFQPAPPPPAPAVAQGPSTQVLLVEIQKLKSDLNAAMQNRERSQSAAEANALKTIDKNLEKAAIVAGEAQKAADKAAQAAKASAASEKAANDAQRAALDAQRSAAASEKAAAAERMAQQRAAAERAVAMRMQPEKPVKSAEQIAEEKAAAERAAAARAAKAASEKAAADRAAAAAERAAAEKAKAAAAAAAAAPVREKPIQYPRVPD